MPPPDFPDWLAPGAIMRERPNTEYVLTGLRYVVMGTELTLPEVPWHGNGMTPGGYTVSLAPFDYEEQEVRLQGMNGSGPLELNLSALLDLYEWTGEHFTPDGAITMQGTTMPVTMHMAAILPMERIIIQGSPLHDGEYMIEAVTERITGPRGFEIRAVDVRDIIRLDNPLDREPNEEADIAELERTIREQRVLPSEVIEALNSAAVFPGPEPAVVETTEPRVSANQVWLLPAPNTGLWRTSWPVPHHPTHMRLTHMREADRVMNTTATWLVANGVRQTPPDPRSNRPEGGVAIGQVWEFRADAGARFQRCARWRVREIDSNADMVMLMSEDGRGRRVYLPPARVLAMATYAGDGLPRRTAYEHILEADD